MNILVVGGGGREHAIVWRIKHNPSGIKYNIYCAPGNAGIAEIAECADISAADISGLIAFAKEKRVDLTIIGPDDPLARGITDAFLEQGLRVFGPTKEAAKLEWSKAYAKEFMKKYGIPTADYAVFSSFEYALRHISELKSWPAVIKADGLALGKGVYICHTACEAEEALRGLMLNGKHGESGASVVIEEYLEGYETSVLAFSDGKTVKPMPSALDYKKAYDGNAGPNTGGMGAVSPSPYYTEAAARVCNERIFIPTIKGLEKEGIVYKGVIYFGLILTSRGPYVIEYNARFGDPETQVLLPLLETDLVAVCVNCIEGTLDKIKIKWDNNKNATCVVLSSGGYPGKYEVGVPITGIVGAEGFTRAVLFHAGTKYDSRTKDVVTAGGRVLGVTGVAGSASESAKAAYAAAESIHFSNMRKRSDIGVFSN